MKNCGTCRYYREGKALLGSLWHGSVCMHPDPEIHRVLRMWRDEPLRPTCWTPCSRQERVFVAGVCSSAGSA